ncbi:cupin domain-containing protein [Haloplanus halophilus]|uniref:cupin domain-containing protein n=1 Tax=Haloplanus halophilus TaxID=2949993 RepID=UPI00203FC373|nr:cupin domain-containing protein [Haloplanus sp. GDY1]
MAERLDPGSYIGFHGHFESEGPTEERYWVLNGHARLQAEYRDVTMRQFDCAFVPTGRMHTVGNTGTERVWVAAWPSKGARTVRSTPTTWRRRSDPACRRGSGA